MSMFLSYKDLSVCYYQVGVAFILLVRLGKFCESNGYTFTSSSSTSSNCAYDGLIINAESSIIPIEVDNKFVLPSWLYYNYYYNIRLSFV